jgi:inorganic pyrophosphatase
MASEHQRTFRSHPWHGVPIGDDAPRVVTCFIEIVPTDTVKYEIDKRTGYLKVDRPQKYSNVCPTLYGFIPQTYCADEVAGLASASTGRAGLHGDGDPLDVCVLTERSITHGDILVTATPIGGLRVIDRDEADDKIIAVLQNDAAYGDWKDISDCPVKILERLKHYFLTYKQRPDASGSVVEIAFTFNRTEAHDVIRRSQNDYRNLVQGSGGVLPPALRPSSPPLSAIRRQREAVHQRLQFIRRRWHVGGNGCYWSALFGRGMKSLSRANRLQHSQKSRLVQEAAVAPQVESGPERRSARTVAP